jgi:hypothetical protein
MPVGLVSFPGMQTFFPTTIRAHSSRSCSGADSRQYFALSVRLQNPNLIQDYLRNFLYCKANARWVPSFFLSFLFFGVKK